MLTKEVYQAKKNRLDTCCCYNKPEYKVQTHVMIINHKPQMRTNLAEMDTHTHTETIQLVIINKSCSIRNLLLISNLIRCTLDQHLKYWNWYQYRLIVTSTKIGNMYCTGNIKNTAYWISQNPIQYM